MLIKFTGGGQGGGRTVAAYLLRSEGRDVAPELVRGDLERTRELIDATERQWTYTHGVLSFAAEDAPDEAQQAEAMDRFEELAFAGLDADQYDISWVRHTEHDRVELHFVTPRTELLSGKALNIAPPGWQSAYQPLQDHLNYKHGWSRPDDPERARELQGAVERQRGGLRLKADREAVHGYLTGLVASGDVQDRAQMVEALQAAGLDVTRQGKTYITVADLDNGEKVRLKGRIYEEGWSYGAELERENRGPSERDRDAELGRAEEAGRELAGRVESRARNNAERYPRPAAEFARELTPGALDYDIVSGDRSRSAGASVGWDAVEATPAPGADAPGRSPAGELGRDRGEDGRADGAEEQQGRVRDPAFDSGHERVLDMRRADMRETEGLSDEQTDGFGARIAGLRASITDWLEAGSRAVSQLAERLRHSHEVAAGFHRGKVERAGREAEPSLQAADASVGRIGASIARIREVCEGLGRDSETIRAIGQERELSRGYGINDDYEL